MERREMLIDSLIFCFPFYIIHNSRQVFNRLDSIGVFIWADIRIDYSEHPVFFQLPRLDLKSHFEPVCIEFRKFGNGQGLRDSTMAHAWDKHRSYKTVIDSYVQVPNLHLGD